MLKHKSFVINANRKPKVKSVPITKKKAPVVTPKIAISEKEDVVKTHYDKNEPITISLPQSLSSLYEDLGYNDGEIEESKQIAHAHSYDIYNEEHDDDFSEANVHFQEESSYSGEQSSSSQEEDQQIEDKSVVDTSKKEEVETHEAIVMNPNEIEDDESLIAQDKKFEEDIKAILTGKKQFDKDREKNNPEEALKGKNHGLMDKKNKDQIEDKLKNDHAIFDKIAQSMEMANSYDLGSITMDKKFDVLEKETDKDFTKKIHELIDEDKQDEDQKKEIIKDIDPAKKEIFDGAETEDVDALKRKADADAEEDKVETKDFLKDLDKLNSIEKDHKKELLETLSKQSSFNSTISIKLRNLKSRVFEASGSTVEVLIDSHWVPTDCSKLTDLNVTLTRFTDNDEKGTKKFRIGRPDTKVWKDLKPGKYYLTFFFVNNTNPHCELKGTVNVIA